VAVGPVSDKNAAMSPVGKAPTAQESVLAALRDDIVSGRLKPGSQIVQDDLAREYGVSRVPLREALKILEGEGQVTYYPHRGYFVTELSVPDLLEVYRIRQLLEAEAITCAMAEMDDDDVSYISGLLDEVEAAADTTALTAANRAFHFAIFELASQPRLTRLIRVLWDATDAYRAVYFRESANRDRVFHEHRSMLAALERRDAPALIALQEEHRAHSVASVRRVLEGEST
jgi:DNA-binding GntR family transcriptional regulator